MVCAVTPISPRWTRPVFRIWSKTVRTMFEGAAKESPSLPPDWLKMRVLIPTTLPTASTRGPPLLPGLMEASV